MKKDIFREQQKVFMIEQAARKEAEARELAITANFKKPVAVNPTRQKIDDIEAKQRYNKEIDELTGDL